MSAHPITEVIRQRRTIKPAQMRPDPVAPEMVELILENGTWAPTHGLTEPWRFIVFQGESRKGLAETLQALYEKHTPEEGFRPEKLAKLGKNPLLAPVVIAIGMHRDPSGKIPEIEEIAAVACAVQNIHLTAAALGLAGFWSSPAIVYTEEMRQFLQLGPGSKCLGLFYLGWPQDGLALEGRRRPVGQISRWHQGPLATNSLPL